MKRSRGPCFRIFCLVMALCISSALLAGCSGNESQPPAASGDTATAPAATDTPSASSAQPSASEQKTIVIAMSSDYASFNPNSGTEAEAVLANVYNPLIAYDVSFNFVPELAYDWNISEDGLTYTFLLEKGVKWHDGANFTSKDVKWTYEAIIEHGWYLATEFSVIDSIECPDDNTVVIHLNQPTASFLNALAYYASWIMPEHIWSQGDVDTNEANWKPIGTGAFVFEEWTPNSRIVMKANDNYFKGRPNIDKLIIQIIPDDNTGWQAFLNDEVDVPNYIPKATELEALEKDPKVSVAYQYRNARVYFGFNFAREALADINVRKAISMAVNRQQIVDQVYYGAGADPATGYWVPGCQWAYNPDVQVPEFNIGEANRLLDEAGYPIGNNGYRMKLTILHDGKRFVNVCAALTEQFKEIGIELVQETADAYLSMAQKEMNFDLCLLNGTHGPDPSNMSSRVGTGGSLHVLGTYSNSELDSILKEAKEVSSQDMRGKLYKQAQEILAKDIPIVPIVDLVSWTVYNSKIYGYPHSQEAVDAKMNMFSYANADIIE